jgi:cytosine/adenosine deaminase-related metal-dependent hydrolase
MVTSILLRGGTVLTHGENDRVVPLYSTDVLVQGDTIADIGENLQVSGDVEILDCKGKIVSPGFVNTHHHLWQTQLKGRHAEQGLLKYMYCGKILSDKNPQS